MLLSTSPDPSIAPASLSPVNSNLIYRPGDNKFSPSAISFTSPSKQKTPTCPTSTTPPNIDYSSALATSPCTSAIPTPHIDIHIDLMDSMFHSYFKSFVTSERNRILIQGFLRRLSLQYSPEHFAQVAHWICRQWSVPSQTLFLVHLSSFWASQPKLLPLCFRFIRATLLPTYPPRVFLRLLEAYLRHLALPPIHQQALLLAVFQMCTPCMASRRLMHLRRTNVISIAVSKSVSKLLKQHSTGQKSTK